MCKNPLELQGWRSRNVSGIQANQSATPDLSCTLQPLGQLLAQVVGPSTFATHLIPRLQVLPNVVFRQSIRAAPVRAAGARPELVPPVFGLVEHLL